MSLFDLRPSCSLCGALIADPARHQLFHDSFALVMQKALGLSDEEYQRLGGEPAADRDRRIIAQAASAESPAP